MAQAQHGPELEHEQQKWKVLAERTYDDFKKLMWESFKKVIFMM